MTRRALSQTAAVCLLAFTFAAAAAKRPITIKDFDSWRSIQNQQLSDDGKWLVYSSFPQEGDGDLIIRNLTTGAEKRVPAGVRPPAAPPDPENPEARAVQRSLTIHFSKNLRYVVSTTFPLKAENDQARKEKKPADAMPKDGLLIVDLNDGRVTRLPEVKSFALPEESSEYLIYQAQPPPTAKDFGTKLTVRKLADGSERSLADVKEFIPTKDGKLLVYTVASKEKPDTNGIFALDLSGHYEPKPILSGSGKYARPMFNEKQDKVAFLAGKKLYQWDRSTDKPELLTEANFSDKAPLTFSKDGTRLFAGVAPDRKTAEPTTPAEERVSVDLWHWKDDRIQPIQIVRATAERNRTYRAAYVFKEQKFVRLANEQMAEVTLPESGDWAIGADDREYRSSADFGERYSDSWLVNTITGERKLVAKKHIGGMTISPDGRFSLYFDGENWNSVSIPEGKVTNLTQSLGVSFKRETADTPGNPGPWGNGGWTKDDEVLLYDRYDIWLVKADGTGARNLTNQRGKNLQLRYAKLDPKEKTVDLTKPALLFAEDQENFDTAFYTLAGSELKLLTRSAKTMSLPIKAKNANVLALTVGTFNEYPDVYLTDMSFQTLKKASDANPQKKDLLWGTSELISFKNTDGVPLKAALYKPENFDPNKKYPMIVYIYERLAQTYKKFADPRPTNTINVPQYISNGYLILEPDIAYTTGYPGPSALKCVLPAVQAVVDKGYVDENAIGIQGHSWGGYQIAYMVTQTNRFKAAAPGAVVANMTSAYNGIRWGSGLPRQFQYEKTQSRIGGSLWEYPMRFILNSPVFQADRIQTPILMMHNDGDDAVPWYQGIEFYLSLRRLGKEVYMFNYNGEPHNLRKRVNQKDYTVRMQQFFDHYLKGAPAPDWMQKGIPFIEKGTAASRTSDQQ